MCSSDLIWEPAITRIDARVTKLQGEINTWQAQINNWEAEEKAINDVDTDYFEDRGTTIPSDTNDVDTNDDGINDESPRDRRLGVLSSRIAENKAKIKENQDDITDLKGDNNATLSRSRNKADATIKQNDAFLSKKGYQSWIDTNNSIITQLETAKSNFEIVLDNLQLQVDIKKPIVGIEFNANDSGSYKSGELFFKINPDNGEFLRREIRQDSDGTRYSTYGANINDVSGFAATAYETKAKALENAFENLAYIPGLDANEKVLRKVKWIIEGVNPDSIFPAGGAGGAGGGLDPLVSNLNGDDSPYKIRHTIGAIKVFIKLMIKIGVKLIPKIKEVIKLFSDPFEFIIGILTDKLSDNVAFFRKNDKGDFIILSSIMEIVDMLKGAASAGGNALAEAADKATTLLDAANQSVGNGSTTDATPSQLDKIKSYKDSAVETGKGLVEKLKALPPIGYQFNDFGKLIPQGADPWWFCQCRGWGS